MKFSVCAAGLESARRTAASLASHRVTSVEVGPRYFYEEHADKVAMAAALFRDQGIAIHSVHAPFRAPRNIGSEDETQRRATIADMIDFIGRIAPAKPYAVVMHPADAAPRDRHGIMAELAAESFREIVAAAEEHDVRIAVENLPPDYPGSRGEDLASLVRHVASPMLGLCFDIGHAHLGAGVIPTFQAMRDHIIHFHIHDNDGRSDLHLPPPYGTIDWAAFNEALRPLGFEPPLTLECSPWTDEMPPGRGVQSDYTRLLDETEELFRHLERRRLFAEERRATHPEWRYHAVTPHRDDLML